jgi:putative membrane protein
MGFLLKLFFTWLAVIIASYLLPGIHIDSYITALIAAAVLALLDSFVKPILVVLTIPITILSLGLFLLVINAGIVLLGAYFVKGFKVDNFWWALLFSLVVSFIVALLERLDKKAKQKREA